MAAPLTLEIARAAIGAILVSKKHTGRAYRPARLVSVVNDEWVKVRPGGHGHDEKVRIDDYLLGGKQIGRIADAIAPFLDIEKKKSEVKSKKQTPKFNGKPKMEKPVIALTQEDIAAIPVPNPVQETVAPELEPVVEAVPVVEMNPREIHRQKQIQAATERFVLVDREGGRFYTANKKWVPELALVRKYTKKGAATACGLLLGSRGKGRGRSIEVMTASQAEALVFQRTGVALRPEPRPPMVVEAATLAEPSPPAVVAYSAPVIASAVQAAFDEWAKQTREAAVAGQLHLEMKGKAEIAAAELAIAIRRQEIGL